MGIATTFAILWAAQSQPLLEVDQPIEAVLSTESPEVRTETLDGYGIEAPTRGDSYRVVVATSGDYTIEARAIPFDAYLVIRDSVGKVLAEDDDTIPATHPRISIHFEAEQEYLVQVCALHGRVGEYRVWMTAGKAKPLTEAERLAAIEADWFEVIEHSTKVHGELSSNVANGRNKLGFHYYNNGQYLLAEEQFKLALKSLEASHPPDDPFIATFCRNIGSALVAQDKWAESLPIYLKAKDLLQRIDPDGITMAMLSNDLAAAQARLGLYLEAKTNYQRAITLWTAIQGPDHADVALGLNNYARFLVDQGNYEEPGPMFERCLEIVISQFGSEHAFVGITFRNYADLLQLKGEYEAALQLYEKALAIREKEAEGASSKVITVLVEMARSCEGMGDIERARQLYERCLPLVEEVYGEDHWLVANFHDWIGHALLLQGNSSEAKKHHRRAIEVWDNLEGEGHYYSGGSVNGLAEVYRVEGNLKQAKTLYQRALGIIENNPERDDANYAQAVNNVGYILSEMGYFDEALPLLEKALALKKELYGAEHMEVALTTCIIGSNYRSQFKFEEALPYFERAFSLSRQLLPEDHPDGIGYQYNLGHLQYDMENFAESLENLSQATTSRLRHFSQQITSMNEAERLTMLADNHCLETLLRCAVSYSDADLNSVCQSFLEWKGKATRMQKAHLLLRQGMENDKTRGQIGDLQYLTQQISALVLLPADQQEDGHAGRIAELREQRLRLEREINREVGFALALSVPSVQQVQDGLAGDQVLLDFHVGSEAYVWVLKPKSSPQLILLGKSDALREAQNAFLHTHAVRGGRSLAKAEIDPAQEYAAKLWKPLREAVGDSKTIYINPDGFLCELPFGILPSQEGEYLLEQHQFNYLSDSGMLAETAESNTEEEGALLAIGGVNYFRRDNAVQVLDAVSTRSRIGSAWSSLPATRDELQALSDLHEYVLEWESPMTVVQGKAATEERIRSELPGKRYVHIATHGYFEPEHLPSLLADAAAKKSEADVGEQVEAVGLLPGLLSGLVLAGVNGEPDPSRDDGYLSAEEIQHLDLSACELVVLSACETALGSARAGEGLMSLRRAFSVAGADSVISSLWKVDDQATAQLMKDFYTNLWAKGMSRADALHQAKLRMLNLNRADNGGDAMPSTWGAFVLSGQWN